MNSRCIGFVLLVTLFFLDVVSTKPITSAASPPAKVKGFLPRPKALATQRPQASDGFVPLPKPLGEQQKSKAAKPAPAPLRAPTSLSHAESENHIDGTAAANAAATLERLNRACPCQGMAAGIGQTGCQCNVKWRNVMVDRAPTAKMVEKSITLTTLIPTLVNLGTTMVPEDVSTIHVTEFPVITATSMVPTEWPEFLGTSLVPRELTTFEMRPSVLGTTIVPEYELVAGGQQIQQVLDCVNCGAGGFLQARQKPLNGLSCCPKLSL